MKLNQSIVDIQSHVNYLMEKEKQKDLIKAIEKNSEKKENMHKENKDSKEDEDSEGNLITKTIKLIKNLNESIGMIYKVFLVIFGIILVISLVTGAITFGDILNIVKLKFF